ncbi:MAG: hypothetical protein AAGA46_13290 [Cyanobacteria bacterium P01_F01_bin.13]
MKPKFSTLILLTLLSALLLAPFVVSPIYLDMLRERSVELHQFIRGEIYKQVTGYVALAFVVLEMLLTLRKRGRKWLGKLKMPGSVIFWRILHVFLGVGLLAVVVVHTIGSTGLNFNAVFLWVFFAVTLSALVGVVAETGVIESPRKIFSIPGNKDLALTKGPLIRNMRAIWLTTHIFLVSVFMLMLGVHVFLAYYYR